MERNEIIKIVDEVFKREFKKRAKIVCSPHYYKNVFLEYALEKHNSTQCVVRTYLEMLKASYTVNKRRFDTWQINQLLRYLNIYQNEAILNFASDQMLDLMLASYNEFSYVIMDVENRFKSFKSIEAKLRTCEVVEETLLFLTNSLDTISALKKFSKEEKNIIKDILQEKWDENYKKSPIKDLIGYRHIAHIVNNSSDETELISFLYDWCNYVKASLLEKGFDIVVFKDYIKNPKTDQYQSIHMTIDIVGAMIELQLRTAHMHDVAENGPASHDKIYKNTIIQNFLKSFMYKTSQKFGKVATNEKIGILKSQLLPRLSICRTPNSEVPQTPAELVTFPDANYIISVVENSPKFSDLS